MSLRNFFRSRSKRNTALEPSRPSHFNECSLPQGVNEDEPAPAGGKDTALKLTSQNAGFQMTYSIRVAASSQGLSNFAAKPAVLAPASSTLSADQISSLMQQAVEMHQQGRIEQACKSYEAILAGQADHCGALNMLGVALHQTGQTARAIEYLRRAVQIKPDYVGALSNLGNVFDDIGDHEEAVQCYDKALVSKPDGVELLVNRGAVLHKMKRYEAAVGSYERAAALNPQAPEVYNNWGNALKELNETQGALACYQRALAIQPKYIDAHLNSAAMLQALGQQRDAIGSLKRVVELKPNHGVAWSYLGALWKQLGEMEACKQCYEEAVKIAPRQPEWRHHLGVALSELRLYQEALAQFEQALVIQPKFVDALCGKSVTLCEIGQHQAALQACDEALRIKPDMPEAYLNRGNALKALGHNDAALESYRQALQLKPDYVDGHNNLGDLLREIGQYEEALQSFETVLACKPDASFLRGLHMNTAMQICDWDRHARWFPQILERLERSERVALPFPVLALIDSLPLQRRASELWVNCKAPESHLLPPIDKREKKAKIKIGYYSADFHEHATAFLMAELFEQHDRGRFEVIAFSFGPDHQDPMRKRLLAAFDQFIDVRSMSDLAVAELSRDMQIDIAVDLKGFTAYNRVGIFSYRAAPVQVNYLGYPGTLGASYMDYLIADHTLVPKEVQAGYSEKIVYLPHSYQVNDSTRRISEHLPSRAEVGLPDQGFVFCCFNNNYKITPDVFSCWMRILSRVPNSVLWLLKDNDIVVRNLRKQADRRGVNPNRLVFAERVPLADHLSRHRLADLFIDSLPCNAHTTASDALWAGLPVLTQAGEAFAGRVAASLLNALGLPELITSTQEDYEALAVSLAHDRSKLSELKQRLAASLQTSPLFDTKRFTRHIESAYTAMYNRHHDGLSPDHIEVAG